MKNKEANTTPEDSVQRNLKYPRIGTSLFVSYIDSFPKIQKIKLYKFNQLGEIVSVVFENSEEFPNGEVLNILDTHFLTDSDADVPYFFKLQTILRCKFTLDVEEVKDIKYFLTAEDAIAHKKKLIENKYKSKPTSSIFFFEIHLEENQ